MIPSMYVKSDFSRIWWAPRTTSIKPALELMYYDYKNLYLPEYANQINTVYEKNYGYRLNGLNKKDNKVDNKKDNRK